MSEAEKTSLRRMSDGIDAGRACSSNPEPLLKKTQPIRNFLHKLNSSSAPSRLVADRVFPRQGFLSGFPVVRAPEGLAVFSSFLCMTII